MSNNTSTLIQSFKASEPVKEGMAVAYNPSSPSYEPRVHKALADELIVGIAKSTSDINDMLTLSALTAGNTLDVLVGEDVAAGDELGLKPVSASSGEAGIFYTTNSGAISSKIVAMESASEGEKCRAICYTCPTIADQAASLNTNGQYVGGPDKHMYFLPTGVPVNSSANVGNDSTPIYMAGGKFKACTSAGGLTIDSLTAKDSDGRPAVGSLALYEVVSPAQNLYYGDELEATAEGASDARSSGKVGFTVCGPLRINNGELSSAVTWNSQWGRKHLPIGAKIRLLNSPDSNGCVCLAVRIA